MTWSVYQHWDPLKVCIVGQSYPPEFYSWIKVPRVRSLFEKIAQETEEDYQNIVKKLEEFEVEVLRPDLPEQPFISGKFIAPPMTPRDYTVMIGNVFYESYSQDIKKSYQDVKDPSWPDCNNFDEFKKLPKHVYNECTQLHKIGDHIEAYSVYDQIYQRVREQGNPIKHHVHGDMINGAMVSRIGKDLYFGTGNYDQDTTGFEQVCHKEFPYTRNHIINTGGHSDATYCPVCPGLIISLHDVPSYQHTYPDWEVVYLPGQSWSAVEKFVELKKKNKGKWWIPGFEQDQDVVDTVETWLNHWTGYVEQTVFDVNMLIVDPKNVIVFNYNKQVFDALNRYGITAHIVKFRHRYFWDGGIHCVTSDLHRNGTMQNFFPQRD